MSMHKIQQAIKWIVYTLLIINFFYYVFDDWNRALHTLTASSTLLDWTSEFATSIDESAWFFLLIMFELETYILEDETWNTQSLRRRHVPSSPPTQSIFGLIIIAAIELVVRLQSRGITGGLVIVNANRIKKFLYASLVLIGVYWAWLGHWLYLWDELIWIGGFAAIEMNMSEWRDEIIEDKGVAA